MEVFNGNCYENNPNLKWEPLNKNFIYESKIKQNSISKGGEVKHHVGIYPSFDLFKPNPKEGQEDTQADSDGRIIQGIIKGGVINNGTIRYPNGNQYTGEIWKNTAHGVGEMKYSDKDYYKGRFYKDRKDGVGELITHNGKYNGNFRDDMFEGQGVFQFNDGSVYRGIKN